MRGDQQAAPLFDAKIVKVEQRVLRGPIGIVDRNLLWHHVEELRQHRLPQCFSGNHEARGTLPPEMSQMCLAATARATQHEHCRGPIGPSIDPLDRRDVALRNHEIRAAESRAAGQVERELDHSKNDNCAGRTARVRRLSQSLFRAGQYARPPHQVGQPRRNRRRADDQAQHQVGPAGCGTKAEPGEDEADQDYLSSRVELADV